MHDEIYFLDFTTWMKQNIFFFNSVLIEHI